MHISGLSTVTMTAQSRPGRSWPFLAIADSWLSCRHRRLFTCLARDLDYQSRDAHDIQDDHDVSSAFVGSRRGAQH